MSMIILGMNTRNTTTNKTEGEKYGGLTFDELKQMNLQMINLNKIYDDLNTQKSGCYEAVKELGGILRKFLEKVENKKLDYAIFSEQTFFLFSPYCFLWHKQEQTDEFFKLYKHEDQKEAGLESYYFDFLLRVAKFAFQSIFYASERNKNILPLGVGSLTHCFLIGVNASVNSIKDKLHFIEINEKEYRPDNKKFFMSTNGKYYRETTIIPKEDTEVFDKFNDYASFHDILGMSLRFGCQADLLQEINNIKDILYKFYLYFKTSDYYLKNIQAFRSKTLSQYEELKIEIEEFNDSIENLFKDEQYIYEMLKTDNSKLINEEYLAKETPENKKLIFKLMQDNFVKQKNDFSKLIDLITKDMKEVKKFNYEEIQIKIERFQSVDVCDKKLTLAFEVLIKQCDLIGKLEKFNITNEETIENITNLQNLEDANVKDIEQKIDQINSLLDEISSLTEETIETRKLFLEWKKNTQNEQQEAINNQNKQEEKKEEKKEEVNKPETTKTKEDKPFSGLKRGFLNQK